MKRLLILLFCLPLLSLAQTAPLVIEGASPGLYLMHTVQPKENYYSIGRLYNVSPKEIAPFNNLKLETGLNLGQLIKVPLNATNLLQSGNAAADEVLIPLYHTLQEKESLYKVTVSYNKLPLESLKKWNNLKSDAAPAGTSLIVGYLKVKRSLSALAAMANTKPVDNIAPVTTSVKKDIPVTKEKEPVAVVKKDAATEVKEKTPETQKIQPSVPVVTSEIAPSVSNSSDKTFNGGIFKKDYDKQSKKDNTIYETGSAATFKSNSGWEDGKYYCLHNTAPAGTIIKLTNTATGKTIYAKVLDVIPDIKQNSGLSIRISNAAAKELGVTEGKFDCTLAYSK